jgi:Domian of unknown function (DUF4952)
LTFRRTRLASAAALALLLFVPSACGSTGDSDARAADDVPSSSAAAAIELASGKRVPLDDPSLPPCGDLLAGLGVRNDRLTLRGCEDETRAQYRARVARYDVAGSDAAAIESLLVKAVQLETLRFACCGWESVPTSGQVRGADGFLRLVSMGSGESLVTDRSRWAEIPTFVVTVELVLDEV